jgi:hypothetical protein
MIKSVEKLSKKTYVTTAIVFLAVVNILAYLHQKSIICLGVFLLSLCLANVYTENFTYGVIFSLFITNIVFGGCRIKKELF